MVQESEKKIKAAMRPNLGMATNLRITLPHRREARKNPGG
jgi:hypothetical protein